ncbi:putative phage tail assembly chaperone [Shewanella surugensis]|uniref:Phage tail assembly chaperone n=1 Tax=Shewanella surugensis TaxID=212020 RepID=A0ABT0L6I8_9GAMM|nr:putative phage tail assembly chaperone [Shewanella surugensis]MCL1123302.1 putative phage tail assembly chaperone [Shewanella surugensis]
MALEQTITLEVNDSEFSFDVDITSYNKYINTNNPQNKVQPATNFLLSVVKKEHRKSLKEFLTLPGASMYLVGAIVEEYQPEFNITVKKSNSKQETSAETE